MKDSGTSVLRALVAAFVVAMAAHVGWTGLEFAAASAGVQAGVATPRGVPCFDAPAVAQTSGTGTATFLDGGKFAERRERPPVTTFERSSLKASSPRPPTAQADSRAASAEPPGSACSKAISSIPEDLQPVGNGTGFYINQRGDLVTSYHVINRCASFAVLTRNAVLPATVVAVEPGNDLAVLRTTTIPGSHATLESGRTQLIGRTVYAVGYPDPSKGRPITVTEGFLSSETGHASFLYEVQTVVPIRDGNSGGPMLDYAGAVVGIIAARGVLFGNTAFAIKVDALNRLLLREHIPFETVSVPPFAAAVDIVSLTNGYTYPVLCLGQR